jgi:hypothetical protein
MNNRCSLCGAPRIPLDRDNTRLGVCTLIGCKEPDHDYKIEQIQRAHDLRLVEYAFMRGVAYIEAPGLASRTAPSREAVLRDFDNRESERQEAEAAKEAKT